MVNLVATTSLLTILLTASTLLWADETLETITITGSAEEAEVTTGNVEHSEFTGVFESIDSELLKRRDVALGDLLAFEAGVQSRQTGGLGSFASISIRASNSNQTAVYLDGVKLNNGGRASIDLSALELLNVESVDIYRGSSPLQLGHGSIGGAVNLKSLTAKDKASTRVLIGGGSFSTQRLQASHQSRIGRWDIVAAIGKLKSENDFRFVDSNGTPLNLLDDTRQARHNAAVAQNSTLLRTSYRWNTDSNTNLLFQLNNKDLGVPEWRNADDNNASFATDDQQVQLTHSINGIGDWNSSLTFFQHDGDSHFDDREKGVSLAERDSYSDSVSRGGKLYTERVGKQGTLGLTTELRREELASRDEVLNFENYAVERDALSATVQYAWFNSSGKLLVTPALNYQSVNDQYNGITRRNETTHTNRKISPQIGALLELNSTLSLRANIGQYYREPAFYELFGSRGLIRGNENLNPESGTNADIGISYKPQANWKFDATMFASDRTDLITTVYDTIGLGYTVNAGHARVYGLELAHQWQSTNGFSTEVNLSLQDAKNLSNNQAINNNALPGEAAVSSFARIAYKRSRYRVWAEVEVKTDRFYDEANLLPAKDTNLQNIGLDWYWRNAQTSLAINNIGNDIVEDFNGFPRPGRAFFLTTTLNF
ncbi:MAG: TonB-dependent receptor [Granulosicoccaceae bacterium]